MGLKKKDIIQRISAELDTSLAESERIYNYIIEEILEHLSKSKRVKLSGFGSFQVVKRRSKFGRNPRTGDRILISRRESVKFTMGKHMVEAIDEASVA